VRFYFHFTTITNNNFSVNTNNTRPSIKMQFSITAVLFGLVAISAAAITDVEGVRNTPRAEIDTRQAANGACCIANKSLKQDACTVNGAAGKCVPGGPAQCKFSI
jgi:hypothetical protein